MVLAESRQTNCKMTCNGLTRNTQSTAFSDEKPFSEDFCQKYPLLLIHLQAVLEHNKKQNLTGIKSREAGKVLHIEDSLAVLHELSEAPAGTMADLGSGAGYPGIPLALVSGRNTILIEANKKKAAFLQEFISAHCLTKRIEVSGIRSEEFVKDREDSIAVVTARAVAGLPTLLELAAPFLVLGGRLIALKGRPETQEIERGKRAAEIVGMRMAGIRFYTLSDKESQRCVLVYEKTGRSMIDLPRRPGMASKRPVA